MTKQEKRIISAAISRLKNEREGVSPDVVEALDAIAPYLDTHVIGPLETLVEETTPNTHRNHMKIAERMVS